MVNVPVQDEDAQRGVAWEGLGVAGGQSGGVEQTETAGGLTLSMVPWGADDRHRITQLERGREREVRERERERERERVRCYIYLYIYIYRERQCSGCVVEYSVVQCSGSVVQCSIV